MSESRRPTDALLDSSAHADTVERIDDGFVDTAHLRNLVQARLFGASIEPVRIGRFPILRTIGKGAMGAVYAAYDNQLDRKIALKLLHAGASDDDDARRGRILREAKALARLSHPGVVHVYEVGEHEGRVYLAMEFVEGADVRKWSREAERSVAEVLEVFVQAGRGLAAAHAAGLVHRDVKPDNIVVGADGRARMIDFGLAIEHEEATRVHDADDAPHPLPLDRWTQTRGVVGTPAYMAAEQLAGAAADARSDQFGFAVALFEALYGQRPFGGATLAELADAVTRGQLDAPAGRRVPKHVRVALERALSPEPEARFPELSALLDALARTPKRRLRWPVVLGTSSVALAGIFVAMNGFGVGLLVDENMAAAERMRDADARRDDAMVAELLATVERDPSATIARLTELRTNAPAWSTTVWSIAQTIADIGVATDIVELPAEQYFTRFVGAHRLQGMHGSDRVLLDHDTGATVTVPPGGTISPDGGWHIVEERGATVARPLDGGDARPLREGTCHGFVGSHDGVWLAATCGATTHAWNLSAKRELALATKGALVHVDRDGGHVLTRTDEGAWRRWDLAAPSSASAPVVARGELRAYDEATARALVADGGALAIVDLVRGTVARSTIAAEVELAAFAPDGRTLAIGTHAGELWWLDLSDAAATPQRGRDGLGDRITALAWSPSGARLLVLSGKGTARVFDGHGRAAQMTVRDPDPIHDARWIDDAQIETLTSASLRRWTIAGPRVVGRDVAGVASCSDGTTIVGLQSGAITRDGARIGSVDDLRGVVASPDCRTVAAIGERGLAILGSPRTIATSSFVEDAAIDGDTLVWRERCDLRMLALPDGEPRTIAAAPGRCFDGVAIVGDAVLTADGPVDARGESIRRFALADGSERAPILPGLAIGRFAAVPSTGALAIASDDGVVLFDPATGSARTLGLPGEIVLAVAASADGQWIAAQPFRGRLRIWHAPSGNEYAAPIAASTVAPESLRPWMIGPLRATGPAAFTFVDLDRTAFSVAATVPTDALGLREWVGAHVPRRRQVPTPG